MADSKPTPADAPATSSLAKSFEDRLSFPSDSKTKSNGAEKFDWADEVTTPVNESGEQVVADEKKPEATSVKADGASENKSGLDMAQQDGSTAWMNGSEGLDEPEFDVNVKLADLQDDPNNPLYSVKTFEELNL